MHVPISNFFAYRLFIDIFLFSENYTEKLNDSCECTEQEILFVQIFFAAILILR